jgi:hypothetical protein
MSSSAIQRLESLLQSRKLDTTLLGNLAPVSRQVLATGLPAIDARLGSGWPCGEVSELAGRRSSGCTAVLMATLAAATVQGGIVGLVDAFDRFDAITAVNAGLDLDRVLWVRGPSLTLESVRPPITAVERAIQQAIRACDLMIRAGGFTVVVLDLSDVPPRALAGVPFTTWLRLAHANEGRDTVCVVKADQPMGRSAHGVSLRLEARRCWTGAHANSRRFAGFAIARDRPDARARVPR